MGFRTVVVLSNDRSTEWENDPDLGKKIFHAASAFSFGGDYGPDRAAAVLPYGQIIEQVHGDQQTVAFLDGYGGQAIASSYWVRGETEEQKNLKMLKEMLKLKKKS